MYVFCVSVTDAFIWQANNYLVEPYLEILPKNINLMEPLHLKYKFRFFFQYYIYILRL